MGIKKQPEWFCGTSAEWKGLSLLTESPYLRNEKAESKVIWRKKVKWVAGSSLIAGVVGLLSFPIAGAAMTAALVGVMAGLYPTLCSSEERSKEQNDFHDLRNRMITNAAKSIGKERLSLLYRSVSAAENEMNGNEEIEEVRKGLATMISILDTKERDSDALSRAKTAARMVMEKERGDKHEWTTFEVRKTLEGMGDIAHDGLAAVALMDEVKDKIPSDLIMEAKMLVTERLPRLITAYKAVPSEELGKTLEALGGITPRESFKEGLRAALETANGIRRRAVERSAVAAHAETEVIKEAARGLRS